MPIGRNSQPTKQVQTTVMGKPASETEAEATKRNITRQICEPRYVLSDLVLEERTRSQILDVISFYQNRELLLYNWGLAEKHPDRSGLIINLYGEPGTGKTMAAHAITKEFGQKMLCVDYAEIESKYVGETSKNLSELFREAKISDSVIFFDEADALLSKRVTNMTSAADVSVNQTRSVLLTLLNDYQGVIIFASNFIRNYDAAFLRRIQYHIEFHLPDVKLREMLWRTYIPSKMPCTVDCRVLAEKFDGVSGSDIANAVFTGAVSAARNRRKTVEQYDFERAIENIRSVKAANHGGILSVTDRVLSDGEAELLSGGK